MDRHDDIQPLEAEGGGEAGIRRWTQMLRDAARELQALQRHRTLSPMLSPDRAALLFSGNRCDTEGGVLFQPADIRIPFHSETPRVEALHHIVAELIGGLYTPFPEQGQAFVYFLQGEYGMVRVALGAVPTKENLTMSSVVAGVFKAALPGAEARVYRGKAPRAGEGLIRDLLAPLEEMRHWTLLLGAPRLGLFSGKQQFFSPDVILRGMADERFAYLVVAQPMSGEAIQDALTEVLEQIGTIYTAIESQWQVGESRTRGKSQINLDPQMAVSLLSAGPEMIAALPLIAGHYQTSATHSQNISLHRLNQGAKFYYQALLSLARRLLLANDEGMWQVCVYLASESASGLDKLSGLTRMNFSRHLSKTEGDWNEPLQVVRYDHAYYAARQLSLVTLPMEEVNPGHPLPALYPWALATPLLTEEVAALANLPAEEYPGYRVREENQFSVFVEETRREEGSRITLGRVFTRGEVLKDVTLEIPVNALTGHTLIAGVTGSGKTTTCQSLLLQLAEHGIPFLVIEPAKTEYRALLEPLGERLRIFTLGNETVAPFRINPFEVPPGVNVQTHIDLLKDLVTTAFSMWGPLPQLIEWALLRSYKQKGWDLVRGYNPYDRKGEVPELTPTLDDFYYNLRLAADHFGYEGEVRSNIEAALLARVDSLRRGARGAMLNVHRSVPMEELLTQPIVLELKDVGDDNDKAFLIGLMLIRLYEWLEITMHRRDTEGLRHLLVVEEAHRLFRNVGGGGTDIGGERMGDPRAKAVETFSNIMSEVRAYGEGLLIIDQIPTRLAPDAVKNTNIRIIHRLVARDDRDYIGLSINLAPEELDFLISLPRGQVLFHREGMIRPAHVQVIPWGRFTSPSDDEVRESMARYIACSRHLLRHPGCGYCRRPCIFYSQAEMAVEGLGEDLRRLSTSWLLTLMLGQPDAVITATRYIVIRFAAEMERRGLPLPKEEREDVFWCALWKEVLPSIYSVSRERRTSPAQTRHQHTFAQALAALYHTGLKAQRKGLVGTSVEDLRQDLDLQRESVTAALRILLGDECAHQDKSLAGWLSHRIRGTVDVLALENVQDGLRWAVQEALKFWREQGGAALVEEEFLELEKAYAFGLNLAYCIAWRHLVEGSTILHRRLRSGGGASLRESIIQRLEGDLPTIFDEEWRLEFTTGP